MNLLLAAKSGWGKSRECQRYTERNVDPDQEGMTYDHLLVLDFKDEYRGLVSKQHGPQLATYWQAGRRERQAFGPAHYRQLLADNERVVLARRGELREAEWREVCADAIRAARMLAHDTDSAVLVVIDEAHFVAPQKGNYPDEIEGLATTGRGEGASGMWVTQRLARLDETIIAQADARVLGGFGSDADLGKIDGVVDYPSDLNRAGGAPVPEAKVPDALAATDGRPPGHPVEKYTDDSGSVIGSEWLYTDDQGRAKRINSGDHELRTEHVGAEGHDIDVGV